MDPSAVHLEFRLTRPPRADSAAESRQRISESDKTDGTVSELRQLDLDLSFPGLRAGRKDIKNDHRPVHDLCVQGILQVFELCRGELIVTDNSGRSALPDHLLQFLDLSLSKVGSRMDIFPVLDHGPDGLRSRGLSSSFSSSTDFPARKSITAG